MRNAVAVLGCLLLLLISVGTGLFQSVPFSSDEYWERVLSKENVSVNIGLVVLVATAFTLIYGVRQLLVGRSTKRAKHERRRESLVIVVLASLIVGFAMVFGLLEHIPFLRDTDIARWFSADRIILNSIIVVGATIMAAISYWISVILLKPYEASGSHDGTE